MNSEERFARIASTENVRADLRTKSVRGAMFTAVCGGADFVLRFASTIVLARVLIPEHFGLLGMVMAVTGIAEQFSSLGLSPATVQARTITHRQCSNLFWINLGAGCTFAIAVCAISPLISFFFQDARLVAITLAISTNFLWGGLTVQHEALLTRQMKQPQISTNRLVAGFASTCVAVAMALFGQGYWALVWRELTRSFLVAVGVWSMCRWLPGLPSRGTSVGDLLRFGRDLTLTQVLIAIISRLDSLLIGRFAGPNVLGLYRQAYQLMMTPLDQLQQPIFSVAQPGLALLQTDLERYRRYYERILSVISLATLPLGTFAAIYAEQIVSVVLGQKWMGAIVFLQIFGIAAALRPAVATTAVVLITWGRSRRLLVVALVHSATLVALMAAGIPWGGVGIALAHVSTTVLLMPWKVPFSLSGTPVTVRAFLAVLSRPFLASIVMATTLLIFKAAAPFNSALVLLLTGCCLAIVVYSASVVLPRGGRSQVQSLFQDVLMSLRERPSPTKETTTAKTAF